MKIESRIVPKEITIVAEVEEFTLTVSKDELAHIVAGLGKTSCEGRSTFLELKGFEFGSDKGSDLGFLLYKELYEVMSFNCFSRGRS
jgi:hypothetical protein